MDRKIIWRIVIIVAVIGTAVFALVQKRIPLGLDLSGGIHLVLQVKTDDAIKAELDDAALRLTTLAGGKNLALGNWSADVGELRFQVAVPDGTDREALRQLVDDYLPEYDLDAGGESWTFSFKPNVERNIRDLAVRQALETIRNRVDQFGVSEPVIQRQGIESDRILIQLPGVDDPTRVKEIISNTAFLEWKEVMAGPAPSRDVLLTHTGGQVPPDAQVATEDREDASGAVELDASRRGENHAAQQAGSRVSDAEGCDTQEHLLKGRGRDDHQVLIKPPGEISASFQQLAKARRNGNAAFLINGVVVTPQEHLFYLSLICGTPVKPGAPLKLSTFTHLITLSPTLYLN